MDTPFRIEKVGRRNQDEVLAYLEERYATSMFLLGNLIELGPELIEHQNSGNFKVILRGGKIAGVFSLLRRGNLLIAADPIAETYPLIFDACRTEGIPLKGIVAEWEIAAGLWKFLEENKRVSSCSLNSKEVLYRLESLRGFNPVAGVRFLEKSNFDQWLPLRHASNQEMNIKHDLEGNEQKIRFESSTERREYWGIFEGEKLVSVAALNARARDVGQVGGVYTRPEFRRRGYSQRIVRQMLHDCVETHHLNKMILFTGENNFPARRVYEKLGFESIGHFGLFFT